MTIWTGTPPTFTAGVATGNVTRLNDIRDALKAASEAWTSYTPTLTNITIGNGTVSAGYAQVGKTILGWRVRIFFGSTTSIGGAVTISLPFTVGTVPQIAHCFIGSSGGTVPLTGTAYLSNGATTVQPFHPTSTSNGTLIQLGSAALTMGTNADILLQGGTIEAA